MTARSVEDGTRAVPIFPPSCSYPPLFHADRRVTGIQGDGGLRAILDPLVQDLELRRWESHVSGRHRLLVARTLGTKMSKKQIVAD